MPISDWLVGIVEGGLSLDTTAGAIVAAYQSIGQAGKNRGLQATLDIFRERLNDLADRVDLECVKRDEVQVSVIVNHCLEILDRTEEPEKIRAAVNILRNPALKIGDPEKLEYAELKHFARCLDTLTLEALHVLREVVRFERDLDVTSQRIAERLKISQELTVGLLRQLDGCDFVALVFSGSGKVFGEDQHRVVRRPMAAKFVQYVLDAGKTA